MDIRASVPWNNRGRCTAHRSARPARPWTTPTADASAAVQTGGLRACRRGSRTAGRAFPVSAALKTMLWPSGMNRALTIVCGSNVFVVKRIGAALRGAIARPAKTPPLAATTSAASTANARRGVRLRSAGGAMTAVADVALPESASSANATSRADWNRSAGFFSRQWRMMRSSRRRNVGSRAGELGRVFLEDRRHRVGGRVALERALAGQHFVEHRAEGEQIAARVDGLPAHLLGRHVADRAHHRARVGHRRRRIVAPCVAKAEPASASAVRARPKSRIFTWPSCSRKMFSGLRSRWTIPLSCAAASPRAI